MCFYAVKNPSRNLDYTLKISDVTGGGKCKQLWKLGLCMYTYWGMHIIDMI